MSRQNLTQSTMVCLACLLTTLTAAAQGRESPVPAYVIEIGKEDGCTFAPVGRSGNQGSLNYTLPVPATQPPDRVGLPTISIITFSARQSGDAWNISVTLGRGEFYDAGDQQVASFSARTGEHVLLNEVARYGLNPFTVAVVNVLAQQARPPYFSNRTSSLVTQKIEANLLPEPYRVFLRNDSGKDLMAIQYNTYKDRRLMYLKWLEAGPDQPLAKTGEVYRLDVLSEDHTCADASGYRPTQTDRIELATAFFADGSYEGAPGLAAMIKGDAIGNRKHLPRVVSALNELSEREVVTAAEVIYQLNELAASLDENAESYLLDELQSDFPMLGADSTAGLAHYIKHGQHEVKQYLLADVRTLEAAGNTQDDKVVSEWLRRTKARYAHWLSVAERLTAR